GHERPGPFAPPPLQGPPRYYEPVRQRAAPRYSAAPSGNAPPPGLSLSPRPLKPRAVSRHAFSRSMRKPQTRLTPPLRRTPPGQETPHPPGSSRDKRQHPGFDVISLFRHFTRQSSSRSLPDA